MTVRLITLGDLRGTHDGVEQDWLRSQSLRAALLTYWRSNGQPRDVLQTLLWPDAEAKLVSKRPDQTVFEWPARDCR
jgi:hypothetical protein